MWERRRAVRGGLMVKVLIVENEGLFRDMLKISLGLYPIWRLLTRCPTVTQRSKPPANCNPMLY